MQQTLSSPFAFVFGNPRAGRAVKDERPPIAPAAAVSTEAEAGYVYLTASRAMPGFVQVATSQEDPEGLTWSLQTVSGVTHFRNVFAVRTTDRHALAARFRQAVIFDQIPHHKDLFKIPLRFARNILEVEAKSLRPLDPAPRRERRLSMALVATMAVALALPLALFVHPPQRPSVAPAPAPSAVSAEVVKPQFRFSKM
jgi:hypothetical protein